MLFPSIVLWILFGIAPGEVPTLQMPAAVTVVIETELGAITLEVDQAHAPITSANFLKYVDGGFYDGGEFHRAVRPDNEVRQDAPIEVVQARINQQRLAEQFPPIPLEQTSVTGLKHRDGTVSMARDVTLTAPGPDTALSDFFICIGHRPSLDFGGNRSPDRRGFAPFARVVGGADVVKRIQMSPTPKDQPARFGAAAGQTLVPPITILRAHRN
jgi:peptidyl-prolyl cis-trans isomerase A (cyclophilin A)